MRDKTQKKCVSLPHGPVVQWIEFKIPVLTMKVRILSGLLRATNVALFFAHYPRLMAMLHCKDMIFFLIYASEGDYN